MVHSILVHSSFLLTDPQIPNSRINPPDKMYKLLGILACSALLAVAYAEEANIISDTKIVIDGKKTEFRGNKNHIALHVSTALGP